jgi:hypothetical protein
MKNNDKKKQTRIAKYSDVFSDRLKIPIFQQNRKTFFKSVPSKCEQTILCLKKRQLPIIKTGLPCS